MTTQPAAPQRRNPLRSLRHRNFRLFVSGQMISLIGTWMQSVAQSWLIYRLTKSALMLGGIGFASQIPVLLLGAIGGHVADRYDRRRVLILTQSASMFLAGILAALTLSGRIHEWHLFVLAALLGIVNAFDIPARQSFLVQMVTREDLINAIALNSSMFNGARIVGPAIAGLLVALIGEGWCFLANALSYIAVIAGLLMMNVPRLASPPEVKSVFANVREGFRFVATTKPVRALLIMIGLVSITAMPYTVLMPVFAEEVFNSGARGLGILLGAAGVGAFAGSVMLALRTSLRGLGTWVAVACGTFGVSLILFGFSRIFLLSIVTLAVAGASMIVQTASSNTLIQSMVPDEFRGRVMSVYMIMFVGMGPFGALLFGAAAEKAGAPATVAIGGALTLAGAIAFTIHLPKLRGPARELILAQQPGGNEPVQ